MPPTADYLQALAEAVAPLSHSLAAGLLIRPVPVSSPASDGEEDPIYGGQDAAHLLCIDLDKTLKDCVPSMRSAMEELGRRNLEDLEELVDELAAPALELVDMSRRIWETPFPPEAEGARPLLATLAEAPVTQLLQWILEVMHLVVDPWSLSDDPEAPDPGFVLEVPDRPVREALQRWKREHPGVLPEEVLR